MCIRDRSQPILNILHRDSVFQKQGCARISEIVETNRTKAVLLQDPFEMVGHKIRLIWDTQLVDIDAVSYTHLFAPTSCIINQYPPASVMELVDVTDSKSVGGDTVWVRVPPLAPVENTQVFHELKT